VDHPLYETYRGMIKRCQNKNHHAFKNYGARGIYVCQKWLGKGGFWNFVSDVGAKPSPRHTLDRFPDKNGNYCPENVRWATWKEQCRNKRGNRLFDYKGKQRTLPEISEMTNLTVSVIGQRVRNGWSEEIAFSLPPFDRGGRRDAKSGMDERML